MERPTARIVGPGPYHLEIFYRICRQSGATGKLVADAQHAAVAVEHGCTFVTTDSDFSRFPRPSMAPPARSRRVVAPYSPIPVNLITPLTGGECGKYTAVVGFECGARPGP